MASVGEAVDYVAYSEDGQAGPGGPGATSAAPVHGAPAEPDSGDDSGDDDRGDSGRRRLLGGGSAAAEPLLLRDDSYAGADAGGEDSDRGEGLDIPCCTFDVDLGEALERRMRKRERYARFESDNFLPQTSAVRRQWLKEQDDNGLSSQEWERWAAMGLIGLTMGLVSFFLRQTIQVITETKHRAVDHYHDQEKFLMALLLTLVYSLAFALVSAGLVVYVEPAAASSGVPEMIAFLNGVRVPKIFNIRTAVVKVLSLVCAVGSGLPVGAEGPMVHIGGIIGAGLTQGRSATLGFNTRYFERFRNVCDRRDFITCGVACGAASAFGAPIGGLLFAM